jgi:hypothetical protein
MLQKLSPAFTVHWVGTDPGAVVAGAGVAGAAVAGAVVVVVGVVVVVVGVVVAVVVGAAVVVVDATVVVVVVGSVVVVVVVESVVDGAMVVVSLDTAVRADEGALDAGVPATESPLLHAATSVAKTPTARRIETQRRTAATVHRMSSRSQ